MRDDAGGEGTDRDDLPVTEPALRPGARDDAAGDAARSGVSPETLERGASLGRYLILDRLGQGGMGVVYAAYDPELDRKVAVKLLRDDRARDGGARLLREAQAMARLQHPNVIAVHDVATFGGRVFVAMEFVDGETLAEFVRSRSLSWREVVDLYSQAGRGLQAAHAAGLVHRDFKPENALVGRDGRVRVLDFGLARATLDAPELAMGPVDLGGEATAGGLLATPLTRAGAVMGLRPSSLPSSSRASPPTRVATSTASRSPSIARSTAGCRSPRPRRFSPRPAPGASRMLPRTARCPAGCVAWCSAPWRRIRRRAMATSPISSRPLPPTREPGGERACAGRRWPRWCSSRPAPPGGEWAVPRVCAAAPRRGSPASGTRPVARPWHRPSAPRVRRSRRRPGPRLGTHSTPMAPSGSPPVPTLARRRGGAGSSRRRCSIGA